MATEAQRLIGLSLNKIISSRSRKGGISLHRNLLVASVLLKARDVYVADTANANKVKSLGGDVITSVHVGDVKNKQQEHLPGVFDTESSLKASDRMEASEDEEDMDTSDVQCVPESIGEPTVFEDALQFQFERNKTDCVMRLDSKDFVRDDVLVDDDEQCKENIYPLSDSDVKFDNICTSVSSKRKRTHAEEDYTVWSGQSESGNSHIRPLYKKHRTDLAHSNSVDSDGLTTGTSTSDDLNHHYSLSTLSCVGYSNDVVADHFGSSHKTVLVATM